MKKKLKQATFCQQTMLGCCTVPYTTHEALQWELTGEDGRGRKMLNNSKPLTASLM